VGLLILGALSDERTGLSFTISAGPRQCIHSEVRIPWDSRPHFTASDSKLRLAGLRRRYSTAPPYECDNSLGRPNGLPTWSRSYLNGPLYIVSPILGKYLLLDRFHGHGWFRSNEMFPQVYSFSFSYPWTHLFHTQRWFLSKNRISTETCLLIRF
jgi:hypothetical protein